MAKSTEYQQGCEAYKNGAAVEENPHPDKYGSKTKRKQWDGGWWSAAVYDLHYGNKSKAKARMQAVWGIEQTRDELVTRIGDLRHLPLEKLRRMVGIVESE